MDEDVAKREHFLCANTIPLNYHMCAVSNKIAFVHLMNLLIFCAFGSFKPIEILSSGDLNIRIHNKTISGGIVNVNDCDSKLQINCSKFSYSHKAFKRLTPHMQVWMYKELCEYTKSTAENERLKLQ